MVRHDYVLAFLDARESPVLTWVEDRRVFEIDPRAFALVHVVCGLFQVALRAAVEYNASHFLLLACDVDYTDWTARFGESSNLQRQKDAFEIRTNELILLPVFLDGLFDGLAQFILLHHLE